MYNNYEFKKYKVKINGNYVINGRIIIRGGQNSINIEKNFHCNSGRYHNIIGGDDTTALVTRGYGNIFIGENVGISNSTVVSAKKIVIEKNVLIGGGCKIYDTDFHSINYDNRMCQPDLHIAMKEVLIKEGAFIGAHSIILKGTVVGKHSIIGAGSVVSGNIPDNEIWAGNPAVFIRKI